MIDPADYPLTTPLVSYDDDYTTYSLGVGRKFNESFSAAILVGYEEPFGGFASNPGPSDGFRSVGLSASHTIDDIKISGGIRYVDVGDSHVTLGGGIPSASFTDNHVVALGLKIGYTF